MLSVDTVKDMSVGRSEVFKSCVSAEAHRVLHFHEYLHNNAHYVNKRFIVHCSQLHGLYHESQTQSVSSQSTFMRFNNTIVSKCRIEFETALTDADSHTNGRDEEKFKYSCALSQARDYL